LFLYIIKSIKIFVTKLLGKCGCDKVEVNGIVGYVTESANISWTVPTNFTCPHKYIFESIEKPNMTSPAGFMLGKHKIPYIYTLYGGKKVTCNVEVNVRYVGK
jgi:hypothetical protein